MARRSAPPPKPKSPILTVGQKRRRIERSQKCITSLETMRHYWTPEDDEELKRHEAAGLSASEIAARLNTTRSAIIGRSNRLRGNLFASDAARRNRQSTGAAKKCEIPGPAPHRWTKEQVELMLSMWPDHSVGEIADALGTTRRTVYGKFWRIGLRVRESATATHRR